MSRLEKGLSQPTPVGLTADTTDAAAHTDTSETDQAAAKQLRAFGEAHREVQAIYLFGSKARSAAGPLSDLDVALLLDPEVFGKKSEELPFGPEAHYTAVLQSTLRRADVDVVLLQRASSLLAHRVIAEGQLVFCRDERARALFHARTLCRYLDSKPLRELGRFYTRRRLVEDRFGRSR
ncbi:MAG: nucleotidyltransferase domain-containing protein [Acidobacteriota bacterium]